MKRDNFDVDVYVFDDDTYHIEKVFSMIEKKWKLSINEKEIFDYVMETFMSGDLEKIKQLK